jgi:DNA repair photolyase
MSPKPQPIALVPQKGRGTAWDLPHRFSGELKEDVDDGWGSLQQSVLEQPLATATQVIDEQVRSILSANVSPDVGFDLSINPYRGCEHGCIYCYARPTHSYLNLSPGIDFETRIVAKTNAAERLREAFARKGYEPKMLNLGSVTDAYQPVERRLGITRAVVEVLAEHRHAFSVITKSALVERDLDLIAPMAGERLAAVYVSITTLEPSLARVMEPRAASPQRRLRCIETLARAGVPMGVSVSPVIPFLNEPELERILDAAAALEQVFHPVGPALGVGRVPVARLAEGVVQFLQQLALVLGQLDRRLHRDVAVQVAGVAGTQPLTPLPRRRKVLPCWVPSGSSISALPDSVGTSIEPPSAAVVSPTGTVQCRSSPSRSKISCALTRISMYRSPGGPPLVPGSPLPAERMRMPSLMPAGIFTSSVFWLLDLAGAVAGGAGLGDDLAGAAAVRAGLLDAEEALAHVHRAGAVAGAAGLGARAGLGAGAVAGLAAVPARDADLRVLAEAPLPPA